MKEEESSVSVAGSMFFDASKTICFPLYLSLSRSCLHWEQAVALFLMILKGPRQCPTSWRMTALSRTLKYEELLNMLPVILWYAIKRNTTKQINKVRKINFKTPYLQTMTSIQVGMSNTPHSKNSHFIVTKFSNFYFVAWKVLCSVDPKIFYYHFLWFLFQQNAQAFTRTGLG